jgi:uncharacterized tellurite resistance protein B-like protein
MTTADMSTERFHLELLKLLLHVAWSDDELDPHEEQLILGAASHWHIPEAQRNELVKAMTRGHPLPAPDMGLLRSRVEEVLTAVRAVISCDSRIMVSETETLEQITQMLGGPAC